MSGKELAAEMEPEVPQEEIAAVEPSQEPETPQEPPEAEQKTPEQKEKVVPLAALHEERQKRKEIQAEIQRIREEKARENAVLQDRLNQIWQAQQPQQQFRDPQNDPDPLQAMQHNQTMLMQQLQEQQHRQQVEEAQRRQVAQTNQLVSWAQHQAAEYAKEQEDFGAAYQHLLRTRRAELEAMGMPPQQVAAMLQENELWVYHNAAQSGRNPAKVIYDMAKAAGYDRQIEAQKVDPAQKIETLQKGVKASATLSGSASGGRPTAEQIANMSEDEFAAFKKTLKRGQSISDVL